MKFDSHIIYKPGTQPRLQRGFFGVVTLLFWIIYAYLWLPLATLILWLLGVRTAVFELYLRENQIDPYLLVPLSVVGVVSAAILIAWAEYNRFRFSGRDRRIPQPDVPPDDVAHAFGSHPQIASQLARSKVAILRMDHSARPVGILEAAPID